MIKVFVIDDHALFRMGIKSLLNEKNTGIVVTGEADCGEKFFRLLPSSDANLVLLDINLPDMSGVEIASRLKKEYPALKILAVSAENTAETIKALVDTGINGFISKQNSGSDELLEAIHSIMDDIEYFGRDIALIIYDIFVSKKKATTVGNEFSDREKEIILACKDGLLCKEVAAKLGISINTVNTHKKNIFLKLGINNTMEMVKYALEKGIIKI